MKRHLILLMAGAVVLSFGIAENARAVPVSVSWTGSSTFEAIGESITFAGFTADSITGITGSGLVHTHDGSATTAFIDVVLDGSLTNVGSLPDPTGASVLLSSLTFPITFSQGTVTGLKISATGNAQFHAFSNEVFTFNSPAPSAPSPPSEVPEPSTLLLLGSGLIGLVGFRKGLRR